MAVEVMKQAKAKVTCFSFITTRLTMIISLKRIKEHYTSGNKNVHMAYEGLEFDLL